MTAPVHERLHFRIMLRADVLASEEGFLIENVELTCKPPIGTLTAFEVGLVLHDVVEASRQNAELFLAAPVVLALHEQGQLQEQALAIRGRNREAIDA